MQTLCNQTPAPASHLQSTSRLEVYYYLGIRLSEDTQQWTWLDGTTAGNGAVSNAGPYAHW
jgi:hypothetical protein